MWAPTAFLGIEVNKLSGAHDPSSVLPSSRSSSRSSTSSSSSSTSGELSGIYFGILNIYTTLPQFIGTFISTIVFAILEPGKSPELHEAAEETASKDAGEGTNAIAVCLFIGAMSTLIAARMTQKLRKL